MNHAPNVIKSSASEASPIILFSLPPPQKFSTGQTQTVSLSILKSLFVSIRIIRKGKPLAVSNNPKNRSACGVKQPQAEQNFGRFAQFVENVNR
jgi:hypothetical protein